jgi:hypothetical protein
MLDGECAVMKQLLASRLLGACALLGLGLLPCVRTASAQGLAEMNATMAAQDTLNGGSTGAPAAGMLALQRAKAVAGSGTPSAGAGARRGPGAAGGSQAQVPAPGAMPTGQQQGQGQPGQGPGQPGLPGLPGMLGNMLGGGTASLLPASSLSPTGPRITVLAGTRVLDAIMPHALIDDATERQVPQSMQNQYYDDGPQGGHGDLEANDGKFTNVTTSMDYISQSNQRIKEQLIQALVSANALNTIDFFGLAVMSADRTGAVSRDRAWKMVASPNGIGSVLREVMIDRPLDVPNNRERTTYKDKLVGAQWADRFMQEFRKNKDDLHSEFYAVYVPMPPTPPSVAPPVGWAPFLATTPADAVQTQDAAQLAATQGEGATQPVGGVPVQQLVRPAAPMERSQ